MFATVVNLANHTFHLLLPSPVNVGSLVCAEVDRLWWDWCSIDLTLVLFWAGMTVWLIPVVGFDAWIVVRVVISVLGGTVCVNVTRCRTRQGWASVASTMR